MKLLTLFRRAAPVVLVAGVVTLPATAQTPNPPAQTSQSLNLQVPSPHDLARISTLGNYLAARHAGAQRDASGAAAYYRAALRGDPRNPELLERTFLAVLADGEVEEATRLAERLVQADKGHRVARLVLGVKAIKTKQYAQARQQLAQSVRGPIADLTATLLTAWALQGSGETRTAIETIDKLTGADWYAIFKDLHAGLIYDAANVKRDAGKRLEQAVKLDGNALRAVDAYGRWASRNLTKDDALRIYRAFDAALPRHPLITEAIEEIDDGQKLPPLVTSPQAGAAEALYGLGASLGRQGGEDLGLVYLQLALYLAPDQSMALLALADVYESMKKPALAVRVYERISKDSPLRRNAEIQLGINYDALDRTDEAKSHLAQLIKDNPEDIEAIMALGNILRGRKQFAECADVYGRGIDTIKKAERSNWLIYYFRGICNERSKRWEQAEQDLKKALELSPDQPHALNYLGYSWIDQGVNLDAGMRMIRRAVDQRPDDGYIVDSLGWAYFRIGDYAEAVKHLERAVELKPEDPTINDHLGDAYWRVGRLLEARFQWSHARDLKPEPDDLKRINEKLAGGLPDDTASAERMKKAGNGG